MSSIPHYVSPLPLRALSEKQRLIAAVEARVYRLSEILRPIRDATIENVQRRQARVGSERAEDDADVEEGADMDGTGGGGGAEGAAGTDDQDEDIPYNPKNLPLGWDGKVGIVVVSFYRTIHLHGFCLHDHRPLFN